MGPAAAWTEPLPCTEEGLDCSCNKAVTPGTGHSCASPWGSRWMESGGVLHMCRTTWGRLRTMQGQEAAAPGAFPDPPPLAPRSACSRHWAAQPRQPLRVQTFVLWRIQALSSPAASRMGKLWHQNSAWVAFELRDMLCLHSATADTERYGEISASVSQKHRGFTRSQTWRKSFNGEIVLFWGVFHVSLRKNQYIFFKHLRVFCLGAQPPAETSFTLVNI